MLTVINFVFQKVAGYMITRAWVCIYSFIYLFLLQSVIEKYFYKVIEIIGYTMVNHFLHCWEAFAFKTPMRYVLNCTSLSVSGMTSLTAW